MKKTLFLFLLTLNYTLSYSQIEQDKIGAWYMYFYNTSFKESCWGVQGDIQYRNWNTFGDL